MRILHKKFCIKSPCCSAQSRRYGGRRLQCTTCLKTWSRYPHKRGPRKGRCNYELLKRVVLDKRKLKDQKPYFSNLSVDAIRKRFNQVLDDMVSQKRTYPKPKGSYILLGDGLYFSFEGKDWVLLMMLLKSTASNDAWIIDPILLAGGESFDNWKIAIEKNIPEDYRKCIFAFVSDDFKASDKLVKHFDWRHQLCHFHLIAYLQVRRGKRKHNIAGKYTREAIYQIIYKILREPDSQKVKKFSADLRELTKQSDCPKSFRMIVNNFLRKLDKFRTYLTYADKQIPRTNNPVESLASQIRERTRKLNSPQSVLHWATAYARLKQKMNCNDSTKID